MVLTTATAMQNGTNGWQCGLIFMNNTPCHEWNNVSDNKCRGCGYEYDVLKKEGALRFKKPADRYGMCVGCFGKAVSRVPTGETLCTPCIVKQDCGQWLCTAPDYNSVPCGTWNKTATCTKCRGNYAELLKEDSQLPKDKLRYRSVMVKRPN